ncbi:MAG: CinA family protein [Ruminococcus sp.]|nr:CinA family protein [Ruminococcus sp.]
MLVEALIEKNLKISTAESCTGGMVSEKITNVSGSSNVFDCGVCSYANYIKEKLLGVAHNTLQTVGAVSEETAEQMAEGIKKLACADIGVSTTGIAGPTGGTVDKPVGLVYMAVAVEGKTTVYRAELCKSEKRTRSQIRDMASNLILLLAYEKITN